MGMTVTLDRMIQFAYALCWFRRLNRMGITWKINFLLLS
jgi:hypothetical protein